MLTWCVKSWDISGRYWNNLQSLWDVSKNKLTQIGCWLQGTEKVWTGAICFLSVKQAQSYLWLINDWMWCRRPVAKGSAETDFCHSHTICVFNNTTLSSPSDGFELFCFEKSLRGKITPTHSEASVEGVCLLNHQKHLLRSVAFLIPPLFSFLAELSASQTGDCGETRDKHWQ